MGLLDDAIREHLELKRRTGADPGEIARKEHEALDPVFPDENGAEAGEAVAEEEPVVSPQADAEAGAGEHAASDAGGDDFSHVGQETAELDMLTVLDAQPDAPAPEPAAAGDTRPVRAGQAPASSEEDSFEWEIAPAGEHASDADAPPHEIPGQERMSFE